jgi:hypothetical protein
LLPKRVHRDLQWAVVDVKNTYELHAQRSARVVRI